MPARKSRAAARLPDVVDLTTASRIAGVSRQAVCQHAGKGHLEVLRAGTARLVRISDVESLVTRFALPGRKPLRPGTIDGREGRIAKIATRARRLVRLLLALYQDRDAEILTVKQGYRGQLAAVLSAKAKRVLRGERAAKVKAIRARYQPRIDRAHRVRRALIGK